MVKVNQNGAAVATADVKKVSAATPAANNGKPLSPITAPAPKKEEPKDPAPGNSQSFEDRLLRLNQLWELQGKYTKLDQTFKKLNDFTIDAAETSELTIEDSEGETFSTKNSEIIGEVIEFLKVKIAEKRKALQPQISW